MTNSGHSNPLCACLTSEYECAINFDPSCSTSNAITTQNMRQLPCPSVTNCNQYVNLAPGATAFDTQVQQDCIRAGAISPGTTGVPETSGTSTQSLTSALPIIIIILVIILAIIIATIVIVRSRKKDSDIYPEDAYYEEPYPEDAYYEEQY